jgi:hypothetical protein
MTDEHLQNLLRSKIPHALGERPARDLWPEVLNRIEARPAWSWIDVGLAAGVATALVIFPQAAWLLSYHL